MAKNTCNLSKYIFDLLRQYGACKLVSRGENINPYTEDNLVILKRGSVKSELSIGEKKQSVTVHIFDRGSVLNAHGFMKHSSYDLIGYYAMEESEIVLIGFSKLRLLLKTELSNQSSEILLSFMDILSRQLSVMSDRWIDSFSLDVKTKTKKLLIEECKSSFAMTHPEGFQVRFSRTEISSRLGVRREWVSKIFSDLIDEGFMVVKPRHHDIVVFRDQL